MGGTDSDGHPPDADGQRVFEKKPATVQRLHFGARLKSKAAQPVRFGLPKPRPVNVDDMCDLI